MLYSGIFRGIHFGLGRRCHSHEANRGFLAHRRVGELYALAGRPKLMKFRPDGRCLFVRANDAAAHHQLQAAGAVKQEWPIQSQFDRAARRQQTVCLEQDTAAISRDLVHLMEA